MATYLTRICFNTNGWTYPSGDAKDYESKGTYVSQHGFGHEEWLFDSRRIFDGYHYGFLEGIGIPNSIDAKKVFDIYLFMIAPGNIGSHLDQYMVGKINNCMLLSKKEMKFIYRQFRKNLIKDNIHEIKAIGGDFNRFIEYDEPDHFFNIKFKKEDLEIYVEPIPIVEDINWFSKRKRYKIYNYDQPFKVDRSSVSGTDGLLPMLRPGKANVRTSPATIMNKHRKLQNNLAMFLRSISSNTVWLERYMIDVLIEDTDPAIIVEIKSSGSAMNIIRMALGQLLEYKYHKLSEKDAILLVSGTEKLTAVDKNYINHLRISHGLSIGYLQLQADYNGIHLCDIVYPIGLLGAVKL